MRRTFKKVLATLISAVMMIVSMNCLNVCALEINHNTSDVTNAVESFSSRASGTFSFNVTSRTNYGKFVASKSTVTASFSNCSTGAALVRIRQGSYTGTEIGNFTVPAGSGYPTLYANFTVSKGTTYYITIEPHDDYIQGIGSFTLSY